jgi:hypothetical protein
VAWILSPPASYMVRMEEALNQGLVEMRDIMSQPHIDPVTNKINTRLAEIKLKTVMFLDLRVKGAITQKIEQTNKSVSLTMHANEEQAKELLAALTPEQIQEEISRLQKMREDAENSIVVTSKSVHMTSNEEHEEAQVIDE